MAGGDPRRIHLRPQAFGGGVTCVACRLLKVSLHEPRALDPQLDPQLLAERPAGRLVLVGVVSQPVVEVQPDDRIPPDGRGKARRKAGRVRAAGEQGDTVRSRIDEPALANDFAEIVC